MASSGDIRPFNISVSDELLGELSAKLEIARLPDELELQNELKWDWGVPLSVLKPTLDYWRTQYDWRAVEKKFNKALPQFIAQVESLEHGIQEVHFVHKRSGNSNATPLIFVHGWPGNFLEVSKIIDDLTNPKDPMAPSFHVVAPSLPGYVFSQRARTPGMEARATAFLLDKLMANLGYRSYIAQGGDWGSMVCRALAVHHQKSCIGTHLNMMITGPPSFIKNPWLSAKLVLGFIGLPGGITEDEVNGLKEIQKFQTHGAAYSNLQGTRPQTLAVGLTDSPIGLLAWISEKLYAWSDNYPWTSEELITWTMLHWINGPAGGLRYYKENRTAERSRGSGNNDFVSTWSPTPLGYSIFPKEVYRFPQEWCNLIQNLVYAKKHDRGGHFAAWEVPELLVNDIREFASIVISKDTRVSTSSTYYPLLIAISAAACAAFVLPRVAPHVLGSRST